ncbi:hypothetical protein PQR15_24650 [Streptomyces lydicus]|nr:hypothetical protein [Streptomyces lydicus]
MALPPWGGIAPIIIGPLAWEALGCACWGVGVEGALLGSAVCWVGGGRVAVPADCVLTVVSSGSTVGIGSPGAASRCWTGCPDEGVWWTGAPWGAVPTCGMEGRPPPLPVELSPLVVPLPAPSWEVPELSLYEGGLPATGSGAGAGEGDWDASGRAASGVLSWVGWVLTGSESGRAASGVLSWAGWVLTASESGRAKSGVVSRAGWVLTGSASGRAASGVLSWAGWVLTGSESGRAASGVLSWAGWVLTGSESGRELSGVGPESGREESWVGSESGREESCAGPESGVGPASGVWPEPESGVWSALYGLSLPPW